MRGAARLFLIALAGLGVALVALAAVISTFQFTIPLDRYQQRIVETLSQAIGAEISLSGNLVLVTGPQPRIEAGDMRVSRVIAGRSVTAHLHRFGGNLELRQLLRGRLRIGEIAVAGESLCVGPRGAESPVAGATGATGAPEFHSRWYFPEVQRVRVEGLDLVAGPDCTPEHRLVHFTEVEWQASANGEPRVLARGAIGSEPWRMEVSGALLAAPGSGTAPLSLVLEIAGARLGAKGSASVFPPAAKIDAELHSPEFARVLALAHAPVREFGPLSVRGQVDVDTSRLTLRIDEARVEPGTIAGDFSVLWAGPRPQIQFRARSPGFEAFAVEQWLITSGDLDTAKPEGFPAWLTGTIRNTDGEFGIDVEELKAGQANLGAISVQGRWRDARLAGTVSGNFGERPIKGAVNLDASTDAATLDSDWSVSRFALPGGLGFTGTIGSLESRISARARPGESLADSLHLTMLAKDARIALVRHDAEPFPLPLRSLRLDWGNRETLRVDVAGTVAGQRSSIRVEGPDAWKLFQGVPWRMTSSGTVGPARFEAGGEVALPPKGLGLDLEVSASAPRLGTLASGFENIAPLPAALQGRVSLADGRWHVSIASLRLGRTRGKGDIAFAAAPTRQPFEGTLDFEMLDLVEIAGPPDKDPDRELIPAKLVLPEGRLKLESARLVLPGDLAPRVDLQATSRGGRLEISPLRMSLDESSVEGGITADWSGAKPRMSGALAFRTREAKLFTRWLEGTGWKFAAGSGELNASTSGSRQNELAANANLRFVARDVRLTGAEDQGHPSANFSRVMLKAAPGSAATLSADGKLDEQTLALEAKLDRFDQLLLGNATRFSATGRLEGLDLGAKGQIPFGLADGRRLDIRVTGARLDLLNRLLAADLPPVGPFALDAGVTSAKNAISGQVKIAVGESKATGTVSRQAGARPFYAADLVASVLRVEDLGLKHWTGQGAAQDESLARGEKNRESRKAAAAARKLPEALRGFDARFALRAERVTAEGALLGNGDLDAALKDGHLDVPRLQVKTPDGNLDGKAEADFTSQPPRFRAQANVDNFHYGPLLKSFDPTSERQGEISLKFDLSAAAPPDDLVRHLNGELDMLAFPVGRRISELDLLGGGVLRSLSYAFDSNAASRLNCAVASFKIADGIARSDALMLDATRVRAAGELEVNLETRALKGLLAPKPKRPSLFTSEIALNIGGTLEDPKTSVVPRDVALAAARNLYFAYNFLYEVFASKELPEDGSADCRAIYERVSK